MEGGDHGKNMESQVSGALVKWSILIVYQFGGLSETHALALLNMLSTRVMDQKLCLGRNHGISRTSNFHFL